MSQRSFSDLEYSAKRKQTRRDRFLGEIDAITPWTALVEAIKPHYPKGKRGRPPIGLERMLRMYVAQQCFDLSDEGIEEGSTPLKRTLTRRPILGRRSVHVET